MAEITITPKVTGRGITPIMPSEPPKEVKGMTFTIDPSLTSNDGGGSTITTDKGITLKETPAEIKETEIAKEVVKETPKETIKEVKSVLKPPTDVVVEKKEEPKKVEEVKKEVPAPALKKDDKLPIGTISPVKKSKEGQSMTLLIIPSILHRR